MQHSHFTIGDTFYSRHLQSETGWAKWRVTDKGTRTITAIRVDVVKRTFRNIGGVLTHRYINEAQAAEQGFFNGPPYAVAEHVFDEDALTHCHKEPTDEA